MYNVGTHVRVRMHNGEELLYMQKQEKGNPESCKVVLQRGYCVTEVRGVGWRA